MATRSKREAKRGAVKTAELERVRSDAQAYQARKAGTQLVLLPGERLPDDDKASETKGAGRPVGARTASPLEYRRYILSTKGDYLARFAAIANTDTIALAQLLRCSPLEALKMQRDLGATAAPYIYTPQKAPLTPEDVQYFAAMVFSSGGGRAPVLPGETQPRGLLEAAAVLGGRPLDALEYQELKPDRNAHSEPAHSEPQAEEEEEAP